MRSYESDRQWADEYLPFIKAVVGPCLLGVSSLVEDRQCNADLVVLIARDMKIACRVRDHAYRERYGGEFTFRSRRSNGATTEFEKMLSGFGDWFFYGFASPSRKGFVDPWWIINLEVFRGEYKRRADLQAVRDMANGDGTFFRPFKFSAFGDKPGFLIWSSAQRRAAHQQSQAPRVAPATPTDPLVMKVADRIARELRVDEITWGSKSR